MGQCASRDANEPARATTRDDKKTPPRVARTRRGVERGAMATKVQRIMTQPINLIFRFLQTKARVQIWMYENTDACVEGRIVGFDEYMNLVLDDAEEVVEKKQRRVSVGRILLKGDNITLMRNVTQKEK